ncbi:MAG: cytochrome C biogenesis protein [Planctomyces sp.]|nr:cytochrome C biogenesis protein [Planctomyces sp.]
MLTFFIHALTALYLGILTSISPCPLATNIAAISYIGGRVGESRGVIQAGLLYTLGRCLLYVLLAGLLTWTSLSIPAVSVFLQRYVHLLLGPIFLLLGSFLAGIMSIEFNGGGLTQGIQRRVDALGVWGAFILGVLFAISFCPTSAAWFFGLLALTLGSDAGAISQVMQGVGVELPRTTFTGGALWLPMIYGVGTALPVLVVATLLAYSAKSVGKTYQILGQIEWWARTGTGAVFIALGIYFSLKYIFLAAS